MGISMSVISQVYRPREKKWETFNAESFRFHDTDSVKEAFYEYCKDENLKDSFRDRTWKNRNKLKNKIMIDTDDEKGKVIGFISPATYEREEGENYLVRHIFEFSSFKQNFAVME